MTQVLICQHCGRRHNEWQQNRCPSCDGLHGPRNGKIMFKVTMKTDPRYMTGMKSELDDPVEETELREILGMQNLAQEPWDEMIDKGTCIIGMITYNWEKLEMKKKGNPVKNKPKTKTAPKPMKKNPKKVKK